VAGFPNRDHKNRILTQVAGLMRALGTDAAGVVANTAYTLYRGPDTPMPLNDPLHREALLVSMVLPREFVSTILPYGRNDDGSKYLQESEISQGTSMDGPLLRRVANSLARNPRPVDEVAAAKRCQRVQQLGAQLVINRKFLAAA
jgi:hypothetical protein